MLEDGETILWQDRPEGPGSRRVPPGMLALILDYILPATGLSFGALGLGLYALFASNLPLQLAAGAGAIALAAFMTLIAFNGLKDRRARARSELHYVLTPRRLLIRDAARDYSVQILPGSLDVLQRKGRNLDLYVQHADEALTLYDLADIAAAEGALSAVLIAPRAANPDAG